MGEWAWQRFCAAQIGAEHMNNDRLRNALKRVNRKLANEEWVYGLVGKITASDPVYDVPGRADFIYVRLRNSNGAQTTIPARNDPGVPHSAGLPVRMYYEGTTLVIDSVNRRPDLATVAPPPASGVPLHIHDDRYFREDEHINVSAGAADAGKPIVLDAGGQVDASMIDLTSVDIGAVVHAATAETTPLDADETLILDSASSFALRRITWTTLKAFLKTYFDTLYELVGAIATHAALTTTHGVTGNIVGTNGAQTLASKTLTAPTIADFTNAAHDHGDADDGGNIPYTSVTGGPTQYTDELAQDAVGTILVDSTTIDFTYTDATPEITAIVIDGSITYAKMQDVSATDRVLGRDTAGAGDVEEIAPAALRTMINVADGADVTASAITALATKTTPVDADAVVITDSAASNVPKRTLWSNIKATLKTYFDTLYELAGAIATHAALTVTHGATGAIVGTTNTQTLTNKTLTAPAISAPTITDTMLHNSGVANENYREDVLTIADIGSTQVLTIDILHAADGRVFVTSFEISLGRAASNTVWAMATGRVQWTSVASGSAVVRASDGSFTGSGTVSGSITAITGGIRITLSSTAFGNTLNTNMAHFSHTGFAAQNTSYLVTVT